MHRTDSYIEKAKLAKKLSARIKRAMPVLSLVVMAAVFWTLKLTGVTMAGEAFCGKEEHIHNELCGLPPLVCTLAETEGHYHSDSCIAQLLVCTTEETAGHSHTDECYNRQLICTVAETEGHTHTENCTETKTVCTLAEHTHGAECATEQLICTETGEDHTHIQQCSTLVTTCTAAEHSHTAECTVTETVCTLAETAGHLHTEECYNSQLTCTVAETDGHIHSAECYIKGEGFICQPAEETAEHIHTEECVGENTQLCCDTPTTQPHTHTELCYGPAEECMLEEHIHTSECYSALNADIETPQQWEATVPGLIIDASVRDRIIAVATSQIGYTESTRNFQLDENGNKNGITRYGQWYGSPYGPWNTMFLSFCINYAEIEDIPLSAGAEALRLEWEKLELYLTVAETEPWRGDIMFLDKNGNGAADAVAIVTDYQDGQITVIEGDLNDMVAQTVYSDTDSAIMGYGFVPETDFSDWALTKIAQKTNYTGQNLDGGRYVIYAQSGSKYYAIDGNGKSVQIYLDNSGNITADVTNVDLLAWEFDQADNYDGKPAYFMKNVATGKHLHPYDGPVSDGTWESALYSSGNGAKIRGARQSTYLQLSGTTFTTVSRQNSGTVMYFGLMESSKTVWLDGTNGGLRGYYGSENARYTFKEGQTFTLPVEFKSPTKYTYKLQGWYDVINSVYYAPGATVTVNSDMVFYADWVAASYDIGQYDEYTVNDTVSTNQFITTKVFDYNYLFNVMSANPTVTVDGSGHTENWSLVTGTNKVNYKNATTLRYVFLEHADGGTVANVSGRDNENGAQYDRVQFGITERNPELINILFGTDNLFNPETGEGIIGKHYLGTGDYLFQYAETEGHPYYGYYYYDSQLNAASYNQSAQRFYVYEYLAATSDSLGANPVSYSDFLPLNSPYANTGADDTIKPAQYNYNGVNGEYSGTKHYRYEMGTNAGTMSNMAFGTSMEFVFHLPNKPGTRDQNNELGNVDVYGREMNFEFTGDDDLWVYVDDKLVLDIGGIHGAESGSINFSKGEVIIDGSYNETFSNVVKALDDGDHTMAIYYLERGSSQSNCAMYFNLAPRYSLNIQKEDVISQQLLNGAEFEIYDDLLCTEKSELWTSEASYRAGDPAAQKFKIVNGYADIWGFSAGNTYYIKEVTPPTDKNYGTAHGIIRFAIDKRGMATYSVDIVEEMDEYGNTVPITNGYTVHGVRIDQQQQKAYIVVTNAKNWVKETTTVEASKTWLDNKSHADDYVTVYLTVTDPNGTERRIREVVLSDENDWHYLWTGLPKYLEDGVTEVDYGVDEAYEEGYYSSSTQVESLVIETPEWAEGVELEGDTQYLLKTENGYLSSQSAQSEKFMWVDEETAKSSDLALWTATVTADGKFKLANGAGRRLSFDTSRTRFRTVTDSSGYQEFIASDAGSGVKLRIEYSNYNGTVVRYIGAMNDSSYLSYAENEDAALKLVPATLKIRTEEVAVDGLNFKITNKPLSEETSMTVYKVWSYKDGDEANYKENLVTVKLIADGVDTGRKITLSLKNNWTDTFRGLPYKDEDGNVITYTVEEVWLDYNWLSSYGDIITHSGKIPTYSTTITNTYVQMGPPLPSTGSFARMAYIYCGGGIMLASLVAAIRLRRKRERRYR